MNDQPLQPADLNAPQNRRQRDPRFPVKTVLVMLLFLTLGLAILRHLGQQPLPTPPPPPEPTAIPSPTPIPTPVPTPDPIQMVRDALQEAREHYHAGEPEPAVRALQRILRIFPDHEAARALLPRARVADQTLAALERAQTLQSDDPDQAWLEISRAHQLDPAFPGVAELHADLKALQRQRQARQHQETARTLEASEHWEAAHREWDLARRFGEVDPEVAEGLARTAQYHQMQSRLEDGLSHPDQPRADALAATLRNQALDAFPPGLRRLAEQFLEKHQLQNTPVPVRLTSDAETEVILLRQRRFAPFVETRINLLPGDYIAVGTRLGHRDVRVPFTVQPGQNDLEIDVRATEPIF